MIIKLLKLQINNCIKHFHMKEILLVASLSRSRGESSFISLSTLATEENIIMKFHKVLKWDPNEFLHKPALITEEDKKPDRVAAEPWRLCTVQQVEDLKILIKFFPIWTTGLIPLLGTHRLQLHVSPLSAIHLNVMAN
ncbi:hypothetical protein H5410_052258 [Solanum commersonii]|uniref:Uncharacterized protein n=1 Tax=Solanum commersonii TaxID=4109 RepID=A0A9J5X1Q5_SOLCO|nr:hypothetical protein H5410_052258 [Solanum commersonii]